MTYEVEINIHLYVYDPSTRVIIAVIEACTQTDCERIANECGYGDFPEYYAMTYTPAFGTVDGLLAVEF